MMLRSGGVGVFFGDKDNRNISQGYRATTVESKYLNHEHLTNQSMELQALLIALRTIMETEILPNVEIVIHTDSNHCVQILTKWAQVWEKNGWKKKHNKSIQNLDTIKKVYTLYRNISLVTKLSIHHIRSHTKEPSHSSPSWVHWYGNDKADQMASRASK